MIVVFVVVQDGCVGGKLLLINGVMMIEGSLGGGILLWVLIVGNEIVDGIGGFVYVLVILFFDYVWESYGVVIGIYDCFELSYVCQNLNMWDVGVKFGIGKGYMFNQDVFGVKLWFVGDVVYGSVYLLQIVIGVQYKYNFDVLIVVVVGGWYSEGIDFYVVVSKLLLCQSILFGVIVCYIKVNQGGLFGFGGDQGVNCIVQFEGMFGYQILWWLVVGGEYCFKFDNLGFVKEDDWVIVYVVYVIIKNVIVIVVYVDFGSIVIVDCQCGVFLLFQIVF